MKLIDKLLDDEDFVDEILAAFEKGKSVRLISKTNTPIKAENMKNQSFKADIMYCGLSRLKLWHIAQLAKDPKSKIFTSIFGINGYWYLGDITIIPFKKVLMRDHKKKKEPFAGCIYAQ